MSRSWGLILVLWLAFGLKGSAADPGVLTLEPAELTRKAGLEGREVVVDDRVRFFQFHPGKGYDELYLKRTPVVFRLPPRLREVQAENPKALRVQGVLKRDGDAWVCDVSALEPLPEDLERLNRAAASLPPRDAEGRLSWARWAAKRGKDFQDDRLLARAVELEGEAIRIEAERPSADPGKHWLALAERARSRHLSEPEASALVHQGCRYLLSTAKTADDLAALPSRIEAFLPQSVKNPGDVPDLARWLTPYAKEPATAYRAAPPEVRKALDHRLWADATERLLDAQAAADPPSALTLADRAASQLPDRPAVAARLLDRGLNAATADLGKLRLAEVESLAKVYRERLQQPERAQALLRAWLDEQRKKRLRPTDAEGRIVLARQYESLLDDQATAVALLQEAWKIDPGSKELTEAFLRRKFRKLNGEWVLSPSKGTAAAPVEEEAPRAAPRARQLRGSTPQEVRERLGSKPDRVSRSISQGQMIEQWIYVVGKKVQYVNFLYTPGESHPRVIASYSLPRSGAAR